jgi:hypothetical protein
MPDRDPDQPGRRRLLQGLGGGTVLAVAAALSVAGCDRGGGESRVAVDDLNWACGQARCTASFRLSADKSDERLLVLVRAYAGDSVANREVVGEHKERLALGAGQSRRMSVTVETRVTANRVRVLVQRDE